VCCCSKRSRQSEGKKKKNIFFFIHRQPPIGSLPVENVGRTSKSEEAHQKKEKKRTDIDLSG
jgi:hypothetical protein